MAAAAGAPVPAAAEAVIVLPFRPKLIPFRFENTILETLPLVVPALKLTLSCVLTTVADAVIILPALVPKVMLLALLNPRVENKNDPFDADAATGCTVCPTAAATLAVTILPAEVPKVTPLPLLNPSVENKNEPFEAEAATG